MENSLRDAGYSKEEEFFRRLNRELIDEQRKLEEGNGQVLEVSARSVEESAAERSPDRMAVKRGQPWWDEMLEMFSLSRRH